MRILAQLCRMSKNLDVANHMGTAIQADPPSKKGKSHAAVTDNAQQAASSPARRNKKGGAYNLSALISQNRDFRPISSQKELSPRCQLGFTAHLAVVSPLITSFGGSTLGNEIVTLKDASSPKRRKVKVKSTSLGTTTTTTTNVVVNVQVSASEPFSNEKRASSWLDVFGDNDADDVKSPSDIENDGPRPRSPRKRTLPSDDVLLQSPLQHSLPQPSPFSTKIHLSAVNSPAFLSLSAQQKRTGTAGTGNTSIKISDEDELLNLKHCVVQSPTISEEEVSSLSAIWDGDDDESQNSETTVTPMGSQLCEPDFFMLR
uniref:Uncharacterized protein n=2 Tax=Lotharella globosa TaxID=91324 RepID=A0A7S4DPE8_9EUKA|mmetsp:Transcript_15915/g.32330  ORF Transcript_15915/g.32330 Transcript_15915/m.32330 type:complete len:316 (+) Transcript_15915:235-1182(+)